MLLMSYVLTYVLLSILILIHNGSVYPVEAREKTRSFISLRLWMSTLTTRKENQAICTIGVSMARVKLLLLARGLRVVSSVCLSLIDCHYSTHFLSSLALLVSLKSQDPIMYHLYEKFKDDAKKKKAPSIEEVRLAANLPPIDTCESNIILTNLKASSVDAGITEDSDELNPAAVVSSSG